MKEIRKSIILGLAGLPLILGAEVIYDETFGGAGATLAGQQPAVTDEGAVWIGDSLLDNGQWGADNIGEAAYASMWLPIDFEPETVYTVTLDMNMSESTDWYWTAIGFTEWGEPLGTGFNVHPDKAACWMLARERGAVAAFPGPAVDNGSWAAVESFFTPGNNTILQIVLETGTELKNTTVSMFVNGQQVDIDESSDGLSRIGVDVRFLNFVGIGRATTAHTMNRFTVETGVPAPDDPDQWAGYPLADDQGNVNTGDWLGWVNVTYAPYIWSHDLNGYLYLDEAAVNAAGGWGYVFN